MVSVIIPTYNCEKYIVEAIQSVLKQTYTNFEIIVIDDGSTDKTKEVLKQFDNKITYIYQRNSGSSKSRNIGISKAKGEYIAFLDADDRWKPFKLELQIKILEKLQEVDMVFTNYSVIDENGSLINNSGIENGFPIFSEYGISLKNFFNETIDIKTLKISNIFPLNDNRIYYGNIFYMLFKGNFILPSTEIFRRKSLDFYPFFNENYKCANDQYFHLRFSKNHKIAYVDCSTCEYRINRKGKLSDKQNIPRLILNTIDTRLHIIREDNELASKNERLIKQVMANDYLRLAYYYLSESDTNNSRRYAIISLKYNLVKFRAWLIFLSSFFPKHILDTMRLFKSFIRKVFSKK
jgi:glycosyltransferase involved in cell wall biosynthesis